MKTNIKYVKADALIVDDTKNVIIPHICNNSGGWGKGFVLAISNKWKEPEIQYRKWYKNNKDFKLGRTQFVVVEDNIVFANMIAQDGYKNKYNPTPIKYDALRTCLKEVCVIALSEKKEIQMPKIGSNLAGGDWNIIEQIIIETICEQGIPVTVCEF